MAVHFARQGLWLGLAENVILATSPCNLICNTKVRKIMLALVSYVLYIISLVID